MSTKELLEYVKSRVEKTLLTRVHHRVEITPDFELRISVTSVRGFHPEELLMLMKELREFFELDHTTQEDGMSILFFKKV